MTDAPEQVTCTLCGGEFASSDVVQFSEAHLCHPCHVNFARPAWRIRNLYKIMSSTPTGEEAGVIPFRPTPEQSEIIEAIYTRKEEFIVVVKSRQLGLSTVVCLIILDAIMFGTGLNISIVDQTADDAEKKLKRKIKLGFETLPASLRTGWTVVTSNDSEFTLRLKDRDDPSFNSTVYAGLRARGDTNHILFVSEWGEIQEKDKRRSLEILTGAIPSADHPGCVTIAETTWKGGRTGELWPYVDQALKIKADGRARAPKDPSLYFVGWYTKKSNRDDGPAAIITEKTHEYFVKLEKLTGRTFDDGQRLWWQKRKEKFGVMMSSEHPSTLEEALESAHHQAFFDPVGVKYQESLALELEHTIQYGNLIVNEATKAVTWIGCEHGTEQFAVFRVWDRPQEGYSYLISVDSRVGRQAIGATGALDCNSMSVWRAERYNHMTNRTMPVKKVAALQAEDRCNTVELIRRTLALSLWYGGCEVVPEVNNKDDIAERMMAAGIRVWHQSLGEDKAVPGTTRSQIVYGWCTTPGAGGTRKQMLDHMQELVLQQRFIGSCRTFAHQLSVFIYRGKPGSVPIPSAAEGEHDDTITEGAIGLFLISHATPYVPIGQRAAAVSGAGGWRETFTEDA